MHDGHLDLPGHWTGWRLRGRYLVSPDGERMTQERLSGLLWRDQMELRLAGYGSWSSSWPSYGAEGSRLDNHATLRATRPVRKCRD